jgi:hypothetical protein
MQISAIETYHKYKSKAGVLQSKDTMTLLFQLARKSSLDLASLYENSLAPFMLLQDSKFVIVDHDQVSISEDGRSFLRLLGCNAWP